MNMKDFSSLMKKRIKALPDRVNKVKQEKAYILLADLVSVTPVDSGEAISNWQVGISEAKAESIAPHVFGTMGSTANQNREITKNIGNSEIDQCLPNESIHLTNNVDYIQTLNSGSSSQAEPQFVQHAIDRTVDHDTSIKVIINE